jgi:Arginyl tRNA synthetase N terminal domain
VITAELRRAIAAAARRDDADPLLRPGPVPGSYASSLPFRLAQGSGQDPRKAAAMLAARLGSQPWVAAAQVTGPGYLTVTVTHDALAGLAVRIARAGPACAASDALRGRTVTCPAGIDLAAEPDWPRARAALAARLTARLAAAAGATVIFSAERSVAPPSRPQSPSPPDPERSAALPGRPLPPPGATGPVAAAIAYAGEDAVRFALARPPRARRRRPPRLSRATCSPIPLMLFGTRMPPLPPCCAGPPRWGQGRPGPRSSGRASSPDRRSWRCSTRCPGSRNG